MESWRPKIHNYNQKAYGRTKANAPCRKHPKHIQSPGVCSICLNKKLSKLTSTPSSSSSSSSSRAKRAANSLSPSSSSSYLSSLSSSDDSSYSSPVLNYMGSSRGGKSTRVFKNIGQETLKKSRSMAFFLQRRKEVDQNGKNVEIKRGFWSKLLMRKSKTLMHSKTTREKVTAAV